MLRRFGIRRLLSLRGRRSSAVPPLGRDRAGRHLGRRRKRLAAHRRQFLRRPARPARLQEDRDAPSPWHHERLRGEPVLSRYFRLSRSDGDLRRQCDGGGRRMRLRKVLPRPDDHARRDGVLHREGDRRGRRRRRRPIRLRARFGDRALVRHAGSPSVHFTDGPVSSPFCRHVHYLWAKGIVGGCSPNQYRPMQTVARDAMAKFIANGFGLQLYGP